MDWKAGDHPGESSTTRHKNNPPHGAVDYIRVDQMSCAPGTLLLDVCCPRGIINNPLFTLGRIWVWPINHVVTLIACLLVCALGRDMVWMIHLNKNPVPVCFDSSKAGCG